MSEQRSDVPGTGRKAVAISFEDFCLADTIGGWLKRDFIDGVTVLHYSQTCLLCMPSGLCISLSCCEKPLAEPFLQLVPQAA